MVEDARHDAIRQFEGAAAREAVNGGSLSRADGIEECAKLGLQRFDRRDGHFFEIDLRLRAAAVLRWRTIFQ